MTPQVYLAVDVEYSTKLNPLALDKESRICIRCSQMLVIKLIMIPQGNLKCYTSYGIHDVHVPYLRIHFFFQLLVTK